MSISEREQHALESIEDDLTRTGPKLAAMLAMFARLTAGEAMPPRERVPRAAAAPMWATGSHPSATAGRAGRRPVRVRLGRPPAWVLFLAIAIALVAATAIIQSRAGKSICMPVGTVACRPAPTQSSTALTG